MANSDPLDHLRKWHVRPFDNPGAYQNYKSAAALVVTWQDSPEFNQEADAVARFLREDLNFRNVHRFQISSTNSWRTLLMELLRFIDENEATVDRLETRRPLNLLTLYYGGHAYENDCPATAGTRELLWAAHPRPTSSSGSCSSDHPSLNWTALQKLFAQSCKEDVWIILDCCQADLAAMMGRTTNRFSTIQLLSASAKDSNTSLPGEESFTTAMLRIAMRLIQEFGCFTLTTLAYHLAQESHLDSTVLHTVQEQMIPGLRGGPQIFVKPMVSIHQPTACVRKSISRLGVFIDMGEVLTHGNYKAISDWFEGLFPNAPAAFIRICGITVTNLTTSNLSISPSDVILAGITYSDADSSNTALSSNSSSSTSLSSMCLPTDTSLSTSSSSTTLSDSSLPDMSDLTFLNQLDAKLAVKEVDDEELTFGSSTPSPRISPLVNSRPKCPVSGFRAINESDSSPSTVALQNLSPPHLQNPAMAIPGLPSTAVPPLSTTGVHIKSPSMVTSSLNTSPTVDGALDSNIDFKYFTMPLFP